MSTVNVRPSSNAAGAVGYILYGRDPEVRKELLKVGSTRAAAYAMSMVDGGTTPSEFIACAEAHAAAHGRANQLQSYVLAFHRSEEHTSELQSRGHLVCRLLLEKKK